jgi:hypothetical protein
VSRKLVSSDEAVRAKCQHKAPCSDCPWSREALPGWLGGLSADEWIQEAHDEAVIDCHTLRGAQCAGAAIYRTNVAKCTRYPRVILTLPADHEAVFATPQEFKQHHERLRGTKAAERSNAEEKA